MLLTLKELAEMTPSSLDEAIKDLKGRKFVNSDLKETVGHQPKKVGGCPKRVLPTEKGVSPYWENG